jgi:RNA polymerase sigma-70 factor (ECF subfamily)
MAHFEPELTDPTVALAPPGGEPAAVRIGRLYEQHHQMIRALCRLLLRDPADAEDATQQTFLSAFASLIDGAVPKLPAPWLATIARRECWARTAQRQRQPLALDETNPASSADDPLEQAIRNVDLTALWRAIEQLPRQQRRAFLMREFSGLSYAEVAEALGASESAVESLLVRARRQLRDGLAPVIRGTHLISTPVLLLHHRLGRLLGGRGAATGAAASAGIPVAAKLGAALVGAVVVGSAGVGVGLGVGVIHGRTPADRALPGLSASPPGRNLLAGASALDGLVGSSAAARLFPLKSSWDAVGSPPYAPDGAATDPTATVPGGDPAGATPTDSSPVSSDPTPSGDPGTAPTPADPAGGPTAATNPSAPDASAQAPDPTPADTTPAADTTPTIDPAPTDSSATATNPSGTVLTDTTPGP